MSKMDLQTARSVDAEIAKLIAVAAKLNDATAKMSDEQAWHPAILMTITVVATAVLATLVFL